MSSLTPVAFDIETSGFESDAVITVIGLSTDLGAWQVLNTAGRTADKDRLESELEKKSGSCLRLAVETSERELLLKLRDIASELIDGDQHYLTAYNGERWRSGFDLPFLRSACVRCDAEWPFEDVAYADVMAMVDRFETGDHSDLAGVYDNLIGDDHCDPFEESESAVEAHENGDWLLLLLHNLADIQRTRLLALLAGRYVPRKDFRMKNLQPPDI